MSFSFVVASDSPEAVETLVTTLPLWTRAETTITPLGSFSGRFATARERVAQVKAQTTAPSATATTAVVAARN